MEIQSNQKLKDKMAILSPHLSIIIPNVNGLNSHIERHRVLDGLKNQMETIFGGKCAVGYTDRSGTHNINQGYLKR